MNVQTLNLLIGNYEKADDDLHNFAKQHLERWVELKALNNNYWYTSIALNESDVSIYRYSEQDDTNVYFDSEYYTLTIPLAFFDDPEPFFKEAREAQEERERRKSLDAEDVRRKRIAELQRLLAEDAPPAELDKELTRKYH